MKLKQSQIWKTATQNILIVSVERLAVDYKILKDLQTREGTHQHATKKEFCRMIKGAELMVPDSVAKPKTT